MQSNTLMALNNHLFEQMERLNDDSLSKEDLKKELDRSRGMMNLSTKIIDNARLSLEAEQLKIEYSNKAVELPKMIGG